MVIEKKINTASVRMKSLDPLDHSLELLHFGFRGLTVEADRFLATQGLSRAHHRILYVIARADEQWALGPLTLPHMLVRLVLAEQLYRAAALLANHPYHRA